MASAFDKYKEFYLKPFTEFLAEIEPMGDFGYPYGLFFSHPLPEYDSSRIKVFYVGRDTNGWGYYEEMMELNRTGNVIGYIADQWPCTTEDMMKWGNRMAFWTIVFKLHIYLNHNVILPRIQDYSDDMKRCLLGIGFGNMNCVEIPDSLRREGCWDSIIQDKYYSFKEKSRRFDRLKDILDLYEPDFVYIFSWTDDYVFLKDIEITEMTEMREDHWRAVYSIKGYRTKLIWTSHPTHFARRITRDIDTVVKYLGETALSL